MKSTQQLSSNIFFRPVEELAETILNKLAPSGIIIIADTNTAVHCVPRLGELLNVQNIIVIPAGEEHKSLATCMHIWDSMIEKNADRNTLVLNVGGGMVCDIGGFAASVYQRGIRFANIPTSVLAMGDAAIGGKTGVDFKELKNYLGIIRSPSFIWIDELFLQTLPSIEVTAGLAEIVKHAIIGSNELWNEISAVKNYTELNWGILLKKNLPVKLEIVERDPYESGERKKLNFGHTVGHALESYFLSEDIPALHGNCISAGMLIESKMANRIGLLNNTDFEAIEKIIFRLLRPVRDSLPTFDSLREWMRMDKKRVNSRLTFSLPDKIGSCRLDCEVEEHVVAESFNWYKQARAPIQRLSK